MMACCTELRSVDKNINYDKVPDCALCIVAIYFLRLVLRYFFITLVGVLSSATIRGTTKYLLMGFIVLLITIFSNT